MVKVSCQRSTVLRQKPQINSGHPPISHSTAASATGGGKRELFSQRRSGKFAKSARYSGRVWLFFSAENQPTRGQKKTEKQGESKKRFRSERRGWGRGGAPH